MRLYTSAVSGDLTGLCEACGGPVEFTYFEEGEFGFYTSEDIVNKWMDHQLNDCPSVIDNTPKAD